MGPQNEKDAEADPEADQPGNAAVAGFSPLTDEELRCSVDAMREVYLLRPSNAIATSLLRDGIRSVMANRRADLPPGTLREGTAMVVYGPPRAGKSSLVERMLAGEPALATGEDGSVKPLVNIQVKGPATLRSVGLQVLDALGYAIEGKVTEGDVWRKVHQMVRKRGVLVLHLGEVSHLTNLKADKPEAEKAKLRDTIKSLVINEVWPIVVILSGISSVVPFLTEDTAIEDRAQFVPVEALRPEDAGMLADGIRRVAASVGLGVEEEDLAAELVPRLMHAARDQLGRAMGATVSAAKRALAPENDAGERLPPELVLKRRHFAEQHARASGNADWANPFLAAGWHMLDPGAKGLANRAQLDSRDGPDGGDRR